MKTIVALGFALALAASVPADPYSAAIQQAKRVANQETEANRRLMDNPETSPAPAAPSQTVNPALQATLQNIENLRNDFGAIAKLTNGTPLTVERTALTNDLMTAAQGTKPTGQIVSRLADDLTTVLEGNEKLQSQHPRLAQFIHATFNGSQLAPAQQQMIFGETRKMLVNGGTVADSATQVVNDIKAIVNETK